MLRLHGTVYIVNPSEEKILQHANDNKPRLMTPAEAAEATTFSRTMLSLMAKDRKFPSPVPLGEKRIAYVRAEVEAWIDARIAARAA
ncbi:prophage regulatory protein [Ensifer sp. WSM1721]|uniref:helix-turn-helix transcriptional regulator n=1 Tax=Ensifer sp. WSM1721 TaxID=1041159 RepID=UPI000688743B|nr:AlpA family phage regulatory protein [Ensifer sp. WSM1721]